MNRNVAQLLPFSTIFLLTPLSVSAITIETAPVGNPGNPSDTTGFGSVANDYRIGKTEVTIGQYTVFLNAVAGADTYSLYSPFMTSDLKVAGIERSGSPGSFTYNVIGSASKPIAYVSLGDALRFANWLHNGQPIGPQGASTTEDGAYTLNGATTFIPLNGATRNTGATWFIPSEDEWYKAAYHQNDGPTGNYWDYPTATDAVPYSDQPPGSDAPTQSNTANFFKNDGVANGYDDGYAATGSPSPISSQNFLTDVRAYTASTSPYGTFDQAGSLWEWYEGPVGGLPGGACTSDSSFMLASNRSPQISPTTEDLAVGFRVASVIPEPSTLVLAALGLAALAGWGLRQRTR